MALTNYAGISGVKYCIVICVFNCLWRSETVTNQVSCSELETIVFAPLLHDLHEVFDLRIARILKHINDFNESLFVLGSRYDHLEDSDGGSTLALPELWICVKPFKNIEGLDGEVELAHLVAVVCDEVQKRKTLVRSFHINVDVPR